VKGVESLRAPRIASTCAAATLATLAFVAAQSAPRNLDRALAAQRTLVAAQPDDAGAHNDLANLLALAGDRRGAEVAYLRALELDPDQPGYRFNYGLLLASSDRRLAALRQFREVVDLDPGHAWAHYEIGALYDSWGLDRLARRAYARSFRLDPTLADARLNPGVLDSDQTTAAMLRAWRGGVGDSFAPRQYADRARIAGLLIDRPVRPSDTGDAADETARARSEEVEPVGGGFARVSPSLGEPEDAASAPADEGREDAPVVYEEPSGSDVTLGEQVLDASDLRGGSTVNQVAPGAGTGVGGRTTGGRRTRIQRGGSPNFPPESTGRLLPRLMPASPEAITG
jgi:Flp pilus assembly protein TadD